MGESTNETYFGDVLLFLFFAFRLILHLIWNLGPVSALRGSWLKSRFSRRGVILGLIPDTFSPISFA